MIVYKNWAHGPIKGDRAEVSRQLFQAHLYRQALTEIAHKEIEATKVARYEFCPGLKEADEEVVRASEEFNVIDGALKAKRRATRKAVKADPNDRQQKAEKKANLDRAKARAQELRAPLKGNQSYYDRLKEIKEQHVLLQKEARRHFSEDMQVFWTLLNDREADAKQAVQAYKRSKKEYSAKLAAYQRGEVSTAPKPSKGPQFNRFDGSGKMFVQESSGVKNRGLLQIVELPEEQWRELQDRRPGPIPLTPGSRRSAYQKVVVRMRMGTKGGIFEENRWLTVPTILHRPLPEGARVKAAWMLREKVGTSHTHTMQFRVDAPARPLTPAPGGKAAINVGWRRLKNGRVRVGYVVGMGDEESPYQEEILVPARVISQLEMADRLKGINEGRFNEIKVLFAAWLNDRKKPTWMSEAWERFRIPPIQFWFRKGEQDREWKKRSKLAHLVLEWRNHRFKGDESIFEALEAWRKKDKHLTDWEMNSRAKAVRIRVEFYRELAARLARKYEVVVIDQFSVASLMEKPSADQATEEEGRRVRWLARAAAPGSLRAAITSAVTRAEGQVMVPNREKGEKGNSITLQHFWCRELMAADPSTHMHLKCEECGESVDQDMNTCMNYLLALEEGDVRAVKAPLPAAEDGEESLAPSEDDPE